MVNAKFVRMFFIIGLLIIIGLVLFQLFTFVVSSQINVVTKTSATQNHFDLPKKKIVDSLQIVEEPKMTTSCRD